MRYQNLGSSNLKVSALCLGTMMFGDQTEAAEAARIVASAREQGGDAFHVHGLSAVAGAEQGDVGVRQRIAQCLLGYQWHRLKRLER